MTMARGATTPVLRQRRTNGERSAEMQNALIEAAIQSLCDLGYPKTTTHEICRRANATTGAIQHHFGSKDELILATLEKLRAEMEERLHASRTSGPVEARCHKLIRELWETFYGRQRYLAVWEIAIGSRGDPAFYARVTEQRHATLRVCETIWAKTFDLSPGDDREKMEAMHMTLSFLRGLVLYNTDAWDSRSIDAQLDLMSESVARILKRPGKTSGKARGKNKL
jgi:AcrR family transcriptional regulator